MKKRYFLVLLTSLFFNFSSYAQESIIGDVNYGLLEKYIQAAKEYYPRRKVLQAQQEAAKATVGSSQISYLDLFSASYFYRPSDKTAITPVGGTAANPYIVNGIQYGITLNLGNFLQKPFLVKRSKAEYKIAKLQSQDYDITLVSEVKKRYYTYLQMLSDLKIRTQTAQDNASVAENAKRRFQKGEITLDVYNYSRIQLAESNSSKIQIEVNYLNSKDALEEIIGAKLTDIK